jgi:hypothetical protein
MNKSPFAMRMLVAATTSLTLIATLAVSVPGANASPRQSAQLTPAQLSARLLTLGELPSYYPYQAAPQDDPTGSDKPACMNTLDGMDSPAAPAPATQAQAAFAQSKKGGPWILETLRSYPGQGAVRAFDTATQTLAGCHTFTINWSSGYQRSIETVTTHGPARIGNQSWTATISAVLATAGYGVPPQYAVQYFIRIGDSTLNLELDQVNTPPTVPEYKWLAAIAAGKLAS